MMKTEITGYWIFFCAPHKWAIDEFLSTNPEYDTYVVNDWYKDYVKPGQLAVIRVGIDKRSREQLKGKKKLDSGVYAIVEILEEPSVFTGKSIFYLNEKDKGQEKLRVRIKYLKNLLSKPILLDSLRENSIARKDRYLIDGFQRSTMPLQIGTFDEIISLVGNVEQILGNVENEVADTVEDIERLERKYRDASPQVKWQISKRIERGIISKKIKKIYNYKCLVCEALSLYPFSFKKVNDEQYIETHHIIPVANEMQGSLGVSNLITVCANHHRQFHYGNIVILENSRSKLELSIDQKVISIEKKSTRNL